MQKVEIVSRGRQGPSNPIYTDPMTPEGLATQDTRNILDSAAEAVANSF